VKQRFVDSCTIRRTKIPALIDSSFTTHARSKFCVHKEIIIITIIIIIIIIINTIEFSLGVSSPYTSTDNTNNNNKYI
jgi:uncharacterized integral membrane protein